MATKHHHHATKHHHQHHADLVKHNQDHFDEQAKKWDDDPECTKVSRESYRTLIKHIGKFISRKDAHVLNFGCGTGRLEAQLRHDVKQIVGVDISTGMVERMCQKIHEEKWENVRAVQADILEESSEATKQLQSSSGFDLIVSLYTFHHLQDVEAIGKSLMKCLKPGGYFCMIDFFAAAEDNKEQYKGFHSNLSDAAKASIGTHEGFSREFLLNFYEKELGLKNVEVHSANPLKCGEDEYPTVVVYGQKV